MENVQSREPCNDKLGRLNRVSRLSARVADPCNTTVSRRSVRSHVISGRSNTMAQSISLTTPSI